MDSSTPTEDTAARFRALEEHTDFTRWMQHTPTASFVAESRGSIFVFILGWLVIGGGLTTGVATLCAPLAIVPMLLVAIGLYGILRHYLETSRVNSSPLERMPLLVTEDRTRISGESGGGARTRYFYSVELRDGTRKELEALEAIVDKISTGNMGIGFVKGSMLVDFAHLGV